MAATSRRKYGLYGLSNDTRMFIDGLKVRVKNTCTNLCPDRKAKRSDQLLGTQRCCVDGLPLTGVYFLL